MNSQKLKINSPKYGPFSIFLIALLFSCIALIDRNYILWRYNLPFFITYSIVFITFIRCFTFGFPVVRGLNDKISYDNVMENTLNICIWVLPLVLLNSRFFIGFYDEIFNLIFLISSILIWTILMFNLSSNERNFVDFLICLWLVSGVIIYLGLNLFEFAMYQKVLLLSINIYLDIRYVLTFVLILYVIIKSVSSGFSMYINPVTHIGYQPLSINGLQNVDNDAFFMVPLLIVFNMFLRYTIVIVDFLWVVFYYVFNYIVNVCISFYNLIVNLFFSKVFYSRIKLSLLIFFCLLSAPLLTNISYQIVNYLNCDNINLSLSLLVPISLNILFLITILLVSLQVLSLCGMEIISFQFQFQCRIIFILIYITIFGIVGLIMAAASWFSFPDYIVIPRLGAVTYGVLFIYVIFLIYVISPKFIKLINRLFYI